MDAGTLALLQDLTAALENSEDWKAGLTGLFTALRRAVVFDNLAVYLREGESQGLEVAYARATGRGKGAEADAAWGETIAAQVLAGGEAILQVPAPNDGADDRLAMAHLLGMPLRIAGNRVGVLVLVRFGGPPFSDEHRRVAAIAARLTAVLLERRRTGERLAGFEAVQRQLQLQEDFVATISHELRTPLGFIKGYTTTLLRADTEWDPETRLEFLNIIDEEADRLAELIENVLEAARLQSNTLPMTLQPLRMDALLRDAVQRARARYPDLRIEMECEPLPPIPGDVVRLAQVLDNLIGNATKYAPGAPVAVTAGMAGPFLRVTVADSGPGIPAEHLELIFDRFYRVPDPSTARTGSGLGLYICRQIVQAHRGRIWAESTAGQGAKFFIDLPLEKKV